MNDISKRMPVVVDLQPLQADASINLPKWMLYLFIFAYLCTLGGLGMLLNESISVFRLYQETIQAKHITEETVRQITALQGKLSDNKKIDQDYNSFKNLQYKLARPGPIIDWIPFLVPKTQRITTFTMQQIGDVTSLRITIEKPIADSVAKPNQGPSGYTIKAYNEDTPKFTELPQGGKGNPNNEFTTLIIDLKKQTQ